MRIKIKGTTYQSWNLAAIFFEIVADRSNDIATYFWRKSS